MTTRGLTGYVDVSYTNACTFDVAGTLRAAREPVMELKQAKLDVGFDDDGGLLGYVDAPYTNA